MSCELISACPFFNNRMKVRHDTLTLYRVRYCRGDHSQCARYTVYQALGAPGVPTDLYPNDRLKALRVLKGTRLGPAQAPSSI